MNKNYGMLSRVADSLFWLNRYMERADGMLRLASTHYILSLDKDASRSATWRPVIEIFTDAEPDRVRAMEQDTEETLRQLLLETSNPNSLKAIIGRARENARGAQDHITKEVWEEINQFYHHVNQPGLLLKINSFHGLDVMRPLIRHTVQYTGVADITMPRGTGWWFMNLGKYMERCLQTIAFMEKHLEIMPVQDTPSNDLLQWRQLLLSLSGYELHLKTYQTANHDENVVHQVLANENFTRSVIYSMQRIDLNLKKITQHDNSREGLALLSSFGRLFSRVRFTETDRLKPAALPGLFEEIRMALLDFNQQIAEHFFSYS